MTTCCSVLGLIFLVITNLTIIIAFATPYWVEFGSGSSNQGLWAYCRSDQCTWVFEDHYKILSPMKVSEGWWIATLGLMCAGLALGLLALLLATIALCCDCRGCNASHAIGGMLLTAFLALGVAAVVFGVCANKYYSVLLEATLLSGKQFGWSFWLNAAASGLALLTSFIYIIEGRGKSA
ncbi:uncharacterized protein LOC106013914 [Aplysia californica]|uniref:Uncharacterized protein LOC106013914 n=1 Tax=Aplysia californica TaxID=6500 RepID=A0ABM1AEN8_APLCA|nr:uncharacterized protein LOC106013914 [Aplysia californica]